MVDKIADGLEGRVDALGVRNFSGVVERHVEVAADKNLLARDVDVLDGFLVQIIHVNSRSFFNTVSTSQMGLADLSFKVLFTI